MYIEVSSLQRVGIEEFHCIQRCPHFRGVRIKYFHYVTQRCHRFNKGVTQRCDRFKGFE